MMTWKRAATSTLIATGILLLVTWIRADEPAAPAEPPPPPPPVLRIYDVHDLLEPASDYHIYDVARATGFAAGLFTDQYPQMGTPSESPAGQQAVTLQDVSDDLIKSIEAGVAPDSWRDNGGSEGALRISRGMLIVTQPPATQKLVQDFLDQMSEQRSAMVRVEADWVWDSPENIGKLLRTSGPVSGTDQEVDQARLAGLPVGTRHVHAELTGRNGQTMFVVCGREKSLVTNMTPVVSVATSAFAPTVSAVAGGASLQVKAMAKPDRGYAVLVLAAGFDELGPTRRASAAAVAGAGLEMTPATQPSATSQPGAPAGPQFRLLSSSTRPARVQSPFETTSMKIQEVRTTIRVPLDKSVIAARTTWDPTKGDRPCELLLILTVHAKR